MNSIKQLLVLRRVTTPDARSDATNVTVLK